MRYILDSLAKVVAKANILNIFVNRSTNSNNKIEYHFHGPITIEGSNRKRLKIKR